MEEKEGGKLGRPIQYATVFVSYLVVFIIYTYPLISNFSEDLLGSPDQDVNQYIWNLYNFKYNLSKGLNPWFTQLLFHPEGSSLIMHTYHPIIGVFALFFDNDILALNVYMLLTFVLSGFGAYLLCKKFMNNALLCWLAGFIFAFSPYKMAKLTEHYNLILTATVPFFIISFLMAFEFRDTGFFKIKSTKHFIFCLLLGIITFLSDYNVTFVLIYFCLFYFLYCKVSFFNDIKWSWKSLVIIIPIILFFHLLLHQLTVNKLFNLENNGAFWIMPDVLSYLVPYNSRFLSTSFFDEIKQITQNTGTDTQMFLGFTIVILILLSLLIRKKQEYSFELKGLLFVCIIFILITLPNIKVYNEKLLYPPTSILHYIPFLKNLRGPGRFVMAVYLLLPIIIFYRLQFYLYKRNWLIVCIVIILFFEFYPKPYSFISRKNVPEVYSKIKEHPSKVMLPVPLGVRDGFIENGYFNPNDLFYQTVHGKKILGGYISRVDEEIFTLYNSDPFLGNILRMEEDINYKPGIVGTNETRRFMSRFKPEMIVIAPGYANTELENFIRNCLKDYILHINTIGGYVVMELKKE